MKSSTLAILALASLAAARPTQPGSSSSTAQPNPALNINRPHSAPPDMSHPAPPERPPVRIQAGPGNPPSPLFAPGSPSEGPPSPLPFIGSGSSDGSSGGPTTPVGTNRPPHSEITQPTQLGRYIPPQPGPPPTGPLPPVPGQAPQQDNTGDQGGPRRNSVR
ncbi:Hypothetical protein D9617_4g001970 [Elsinoe fawcettii]|nr:Hypothetical protein D9617_4g001970 [Elsinoe fawcettii]